MVATILSLRYWRVHVVAASHVGDAASSRAEQPMVDSLVQDLGTREGFGVRRAAFGAIIGNMLEFYDFVTYSFFAIQIGHTFFPAHSDYGSLMLSLATF